MSMETLQEDTRTDQQPIIEVQNLRTVFYTEKETIRAVDGITFDLLPGETVGVVGESGSGKSVTARSLMGLVERPGKVLKGSSIRYTHTDTVRRFAKKYPGRTVDVSEIAGEYDPADLFGADAGYETADGRPLTPQEFDGEDAADVPLRQVLGSGYGADIGLVDEDDIVFVTEGDPDDPESIQAGFVEISQLRGEAQRLMRGGRIAMIFQDPLKSLNPVFTVGNQIREALRLHQGMTGKEATREAAELLASVGIPDARRRVKEYPHQFSGGMRQRAIIAMALACEPEVLICDEPTTALDVTIQAQILDLLDDLQRERDLSILFITHDMGVIADISDRVNVMYAGEIVETADVETVFEDPKHPYTQSLLQSIPGQQTGERLNTIEGNVPTPNEPPTYCRFAQRCPKAFDECDAVHPAVVPITTEGSDHTTSCLLYPEDLDQDAAVQYHRERTAQQEDDT